MTDLTDSQVTALLIAAATDARFSSLERARAALLLDSLPPVKKAPAPGLLAGPFLTAEGVATIRRILPSPTPAALPLVLADQIRRLRLARLGRVLADVSCRQTQDGGWEVRWTGDGDGFSTYSRKSAEKALADQNRAELLEQALAAGLYLEAEGDFHVRYAVRPPDAESVEDESDDMTGRSHETPLDRLNRLADQLFPGPLPQEPGLPRPQGRPLMTEAEVDLMLWEAGRAEVA